MIMAYIVMVIECNAELLMSDIFMLMAMMTVEMFLCNMWPMVTDGRSWGQAGSAQLPLLHFVTIKMVCKGLIQKL